MAGETKSLFISLTVSSQSSIVSLYDLNENSVAFICSPENVTKAEDYIIINFIGNLITLLQNLH